MKVLSYEQIKALHQEARKHVRVSCCEYHVHSAVGGCVDGSEKDVAICKLAETLYEYRAVLEDLAGAVKRLEGF